MNDGMSARHLSSEPAIAAEFRRRLRLSSDVGNALRRPRRSVQQLQCGRRYSRPSRSCTSTIAPASTLPQSAGSTMKQFARDIDDRMPDP